MTILALDTAGSLCAAALYDPQTQQLLAEVSHDIGKGHAELLLDYVAQCFETAKISHNEVRRIAVNIGPGSFTGVRVGVSAARGFGLALSCPVIGVSGFEALCHEIQAGTPAQPVVIALSAYRGDIYAQGFDAQGQASTTPLAGNEAELLPVLQQLGDDYALAGSGAEQLQTAEGSERRIISASAYASIGTFARLAAQREAGMPPEPLYMRGPDVKPQTGFALPRRQSDQERG
ncbi:tRNA (adenosine(37)-N6)-threonylcarbamoyltransferase complex dimerization subunit type 1 TsaB [Pseudochrobactrum sp. B5]|uniref:tRNA (adenosine(37)-N6)-threonylcarbamoyltransferase complex dimerization subunit type 1 TsaB n=1 Tax=Pseudochrobactrum sp. B5 TaxID=1289478 RepID=UPI0009529D3A|nr:tRNA (adenosine(37)-N6)-threonylcarbamoyltransferase complex dimerization subunit type 1 TsaB [Pseudochrobactrum sp. B5]